MLDLIKTLLTIDSFKILLVVIVIAGIIGYFLNKKEGHKTIKRICDGAEIVSILLIIVLYYSMAYRDVTIAEKVYISHNTKSYSFETVDAIDILKIYRDELNSYGDMSLYLKNAHVGNIGDIELITPDAPIDAKFLANRITSYLEYDDDILSYNELEKLLPFVVNKHLLKITASREYVKALSKAFKD